MNERRCETCEWWNLLFANCGLRQHRSALHALLHDDQLLHILADALFGLDFFTSTEPAKTLCGEVGGGGMVFHSLAHETIWEFSEERCPVCEKALCERKGCGDWEAKEDEE